MDATLLQSHEIDETLLEIGKNGMHSIHAICEAVKGDGALGPNGSGLQTADQETWDEQE